MVICYDNSASQIIMNSQDDMVCKVTSSVQKHTLNEILKTKTKSHPQSVQQIKLV